MTTILSTNPTQLKQDSSLIIQQDNLEQSSALPPYQDTQFIPSFIRQLLQQENRSFVEAENLHNHFKDLSFFAKLRKEGGQEISDMLIHEVWPNVEFNELPALTMIFQEKEPSDSKMYIILGGKIGINVRSYADETQQQKNENNNGDNTNRQKKNGQSKDIQLQNIRNGGSNDNQQKTNRNDKEDKECNKVSTQDYSSAQGISNVQEDQTPSSNNKGNQQKLPLQNQMNREEIKLTDTSDDDSGDDISFDKEEKEEQQYFPETGRKVAELSQGQAFGEQALFKEGGHRNATVYTIEQSLFLVIRREKFLGVLQVLEQIKLDKIQRIGNVIPFFDDIVSKALKDRLIYEFEEVTFLKGTTLTQEASKGSYIYILKSGRVALEKKFELIEYKEKESMETKKVQFQHRFSEFTTAELIGDEVLEEKNKIYLHKSNLRPSVYLFTSIVLSGEASFLRIDKKRIIERFPKHIVEKLRQQIKKKLYSRQALIAEYVEKVQPNFVENHKNQLFNQKKLISKLKTSNNAALFLQDSTPLSQNGSPSKKYFQNIVRNSILPPQQSKIDHPLEYNKSLIKELQTIKFKRQQSLKQRNDNVQFGEATFNQLSSVQSFNALDDPFKQYQKSSSNLSNNNNNTQNNLYQNDSKNSNDMQQNEIEQSFSPLVQNNSLASTLTRSHFAKQKPVPKYISLNEVGQSASHHISYNTISQQQGANNFNINTSAELQQEFVSNNIHNPNKQIIKLRLSQSIPSLTALHQIVPSELKPLPPFIYNHAEQIQKLNTPQQENQYKDKPETSHTSTAKMQNEEQKYKKEVIPEGKLKKLIEFKNNQKSQISKKIECDVMKKEIIYQHMKTLKEYKQIDPFEEKKQYKQKYIKNNSIQQKANLTQSSQNSNSSSIQNISQSQSMPQKQQNNTIKKQEKSEDNKLNSLQPIKETHNEELTSKQFIVLNNDNSIHQQSVTFSETSIVNDCEINSSSSKPSKKEKKQSLKLKQKNEGQTNGLAMTDRSKSRQSLGSSTIIPEDVEHDKDNTELDKIQEERFQKKLQTLAGNQKKKFYMLLDTWDMGIENLKMKELDLRNGLFRKGIIQKPPHEQIHKEFFEKLDEHQMKQFQKYLKNKERKQNKELKQISRLVKVIKPEQQSKSNSPEKNQLNIQNNSQLLSSEQLLLHNSIEEIEINQKQKGILNPKSVQQYGNYNSQSLSDLNIQKKYLGDNGLLQQSVSLSTLMLINGNNNNDANPNQFNSPNSNRHNYNNYYRSSKIAQTSYIDNRNNSVTLPEISPQKKIAPKYAPIKQNNNINHINNITIVAAQRAKTEGDVDDEMEKKKLFIGIEQNSSIYGIQKSTRLNKQINIAQNNNIINNNTKSIRQNQANLMLQSSFTITPQKKQIIPMTQRSQNNNNNNYSAETDRTTFDSQKTQQPINPQLNTQSPQLPIVAQFLDNIQEYTLTTHTHNHKNFVNCKSPSTTSIAKAYFSNKNDLMSDSNLLSPTGIQKEKMKQQLFLSPIITKMATTTIKQQQQTDSNI